MRYSPPDEVAILPPAIILREDLSQLIDLLRARGYEVISPTRRDGAIVYDHVASVGDLPQGWGDEQAPAQYRLTRRADAALFGYAAGPHSWKKFLHQPLQKLWSARRNGNAFHIISEDEQPPRYAFLGVRACELSAIAIHDRVLLGGQYADAVYASRRQAAFIVAVNCGQAGGTCFCASMNSGPRARAGYDLALTEILEGGHRFLVETGSERGAEVLMEMPHRPATQQDQQAAEHILAETARHMGRVLDTTDIKELLYSNLEHPIWEKVAARCLTCANCTMVCPTCFCCNVEDATDLSGDHAERWRKWDSCFTSDFSYIAGGSVRASSKSRYRQWMTHKLATWHDQFGTAGCVGCGRCITWCPAGIDITEEARTLRESAKGNIRPAPEGAA